MKASLIAQQFKIAGRLVTVQAYGQGNVNDTYLVIFRTTFSEERFLIQRINPKVFPRPDFILRNMRLITDHVHRRLEQEADTADRIWQLPRLIQSKDGTDSVIDNNGHYWRAISLIASAHSYESIQNVEHAYQAGIVLGQFQRLFSDLPPEKMLDTLPGFHVTPHYLEQFDQAVASREGQEQLNSSSEARRCAAFIEQRRDWCSVLEKARDRGELQVRTIHGDPKIANIMIDDMTGKGTAIVDLDTVKPGLIHYDFGDCVRSACNPAGEETTQLSQVYFDTDNFRAIVRGYMTYARLFLDDADRHYLFDAIRLIAFELGLRFFTDFLRGGVYFKTRYEGHNLMRARVQFKLTESIEMREVQICRILQDYA